MSSKKSTFPFNKKNTLALADLIFSDKNGQVQFLKLCTDELTNGKEGKRTTHCAVGEAYYQFVNRDMRKFNSELHLDYEGKYSEVVGPTGMAIDTLVEKAQLKNTDDKKKLGAALTDAVEKNDSSGYDDDDDESKDYFVRAKHVADIFRTKVAPLLK